MSGRGQDPRQNHPRPARCVRWREDGVGVRCPRCHRVHAKPGGPSVRLLTILAREGITLIEAQQVLTDTELLKLRGLGWRTLRDMRRVERSAR